MEFYFLCNLQRNIVLDKKIKRHFSFNLHKTIYCDLSVETPCHGGGNHIYYGDQKNYWRMLVR